MIIYTREKRDEIHNFLLENEALGVQLTFKSTA